MNTFGIDEKIVKDMIDKYVVIGINETNCLKVNGRIIENGKVKYFEPGSNEFGFTDKIKFNYGDNIAKLIKSNDKNTDTYILKLDCCDIYGAFDEYDSEDDLKLMLGSDSDIDMGKDYAYRLLVCTGSKQTRESLRYEVLYNLIVNSDMIESKSDLEHKIKMINNLYNSLMNVYNAFGVEFKNDRRHILSEDYCY